MFQVNLKKGTITVPPDEPEVVQHICLAFVTATLYLLVQPRPPRVEEVTIFCSITLFVLRQFYFSVFGQARQQEGEACVRGQRWLRAAVRVRVAGVRLPPLQLPHQAQPRGWRRGRLLLRHRPGGMWRLRRSVIFCPIFCVSYFLRLGCGGCGSCGGCGGCGGGCGGCGGCGG